MIVPDLTNSLASVVLRPGPPQPGPISIQSVAMDKAGNLTFTLSDGTALAPIAFLSVVAAALGGASLAALDSDGALLIDGKAVLGHDAQGRLTIGVLPVGNAGLSAGSGVLYRNPDGTLGVA